MGNIRILPKEVASKIAAGEVIQRPANIVKELVENAIDANATKILVTIENSGIDKVEVTDNGLGMPRDDLERCFLPHATSKIKTEDDLLSVSTMGFRGEALHSISTISQLSIKSRVSDSIEGNHLEIDGGRLQGVSPYGMPKGTTVSVENMFFNVPVRKKFLKSPQTEFSEILSTVSNIAVAFPEIEFKLEHNGKLVLDFPAEETLEPRIRQVFGETLFAQLVPISFVAPHIEVRGYISRPQVTTTSTNKQTLFVNDRSVSGGLVMSAVRSAYGTLLQPRTYPAFIIKLRFPSELVDINVHPRKEEVTFVDKDFVYESLHQAVTNALQTNDLTYIKSGFTLTNEFLLKDANFTNKLQQGFDPTKGFGEIIQLHDMYLVTETTDGIAFIDQHAAHERIIYEELKKQYLSAYKESVELYDPVIFDLPGFDAHMLRGYLKMFSRLGFELEEFGGNTFRVRMVPKLLADRNIMGIIKEMLEDLATAGNFSRIDSKTEKALSYLACRSAIKSGDPLDKRTRESLLYNLSLTRTEYTCPHGRPVKVEIKLAELDKHFKRV